MRIGLEFVSLGYGKQIVRFDHSRVTFNGYRPRDLFWLAGSGGFKCISSVRCYVGMVRVWLGTDHHFSSPDIWQVHLVAINSGRNTGCSWMGIIYRRGSWKRFRFHWEYWNYRYFGFWTLFIVNEKRDSSLKLASSSGYNFCIYSLDGKSDVFCPYSLSSYPIFIIIFDLNM